MTDSHLLSRRCIAQTQNKSHWLVLFHNQCPLRRKATNHQINQGLIDVTIKFRSLSKVYKYLKKMIHSMATYNVPPLQSKGNPKILTRIATYAVVYELKSMYRLFECCQDIQQYHNFLPDIQGVMPYLVGGC